MHAEDVRLHPATVREGKLLGKHKIRYVYLDGKGLHNWETARNDLFVFTPLVFREAD